MSDLNRRNMNQSGQVKSPERIMSVLLEAYTGKPHSDFTVTKYLNDSIFKSTEKQYSFPVFGFQKIDNTQAFYFGNFQEEKLRDPKANAAIIRSSREKDRDNDKAEITYKILFFRIERALVLNEDETNKLDSYNPFKQSQADISYLVDNSTFTNQKGTKLSEISVTFKNYSCDKCTTKKENEKLYYCYNCDRHFCESCKEKTHGSKVSKTYSQHVITEDYKYKINYFNNCDEHREIEYQFFDVVNQECFCPRCTEELLAENNPTGAAFNKNELVYIDDFLEEKATQEDFLDTRIEEVCKDIDHLIKFTENVWNCLDDYETNLVNKIEKQKEECIKAMRTEGTARASYLACNYMELQRMIKDFDSKSIFIKNQRNNVDVATYLYMYEQYYNYIKEDMKSSFENISTFQLDNFVKPIVQLKSNEEGEKSFLESFPSILELKEREDEFDDEIL